MYLKGRCIEPVVKLSTDSSGWNFVCLDSQCTNPHKTSCSRIRLKTNITCKKKQGFHQTFPNFGVMGSGWPVSRGETCRHHPGLPAWLGRHRSGPRAQLRPFMDLTVTSLEWRLDRLGLGESSPNSPTAMSAIFRFMNYFLIQPDPIYFFGITTYGILGKIIIHGKSQNHKWLWTISKNGPHQIQSMTKLVWVLWYSGCDP
jgi:hypothetical protein